MKRGGESLGYPAPESVRAKRWPGPSAPERVLAIRLQALGDTVITLPFLAALRRLMPQTRLDFLTRREVAGIPASVGLFDRIWEIGGGRSSKRQRLSALALMPRLFGARYDVVIDLQRNSISRMVRSMLLPRAWSEFDRFSARHAGERTQETIEAVGLGQLDVRLGLPPTRVDAGRDLLRSAGWDGTRPYVVLNPGGAFPDRNWAMARYADLAEALHARAPGPPQFLMLGIESLRAKADALQEQLGRRLGGRMIDLVGKTSAADAYALTAGAALVVSEDSGLLHMAWVAGTPTLALFGASSIGWSRPVGPNAELMSACRFEDGSCLQGVCRGPEPTCMDRLDVDVVVAQALELMKRSQA